MLFRLLLANEPIKSKSRISWRKWNPFTLCRKCYVCDVKGVPIRYSGIQMTTYSS